MFFKYSGGAPVIPIKSFLIRNGVTTGRMRGGDVHYSLRFGSTSIHIPYFEHVKPAIVKVERLSDNSPQCGETVRQT